MGALLSGRGRFSGRPFAPGGRVRLERSAVVSRSGPLAGRRSFSVRVREPVSAGALCTRTKGGVSSPAPVPACGCNPGPVAYRPVTAPKRPYFGVSAFFRISGRISQRALNPARFRPFSRAAVPDPKKGLIFLITPAVKLNQFTKLLKILANSAHPATKRNTPKHFLNL